MNFPKNTYPSLLAAQNELQEHFGIEEGFDFNVSDNEHPEDIDVMFGEDHVVVGYLRHDDSPSDFFEDGDGLGKIIKFRSQEHFDETMKSYKSKLHYYVDKYEHGNVHYSIADTASYPDRRWDVSEKCALFVPCDDIQSQWKKKKKTDGVEEATKAFVTDSNNVLDQYSSWCNGEVYGYNIYVFDNKGQEVEEDTCWGFIGHKYANKEKLSNMNNQLQFIMMEKMVETVVITDTNIANANLPFKIIKRGLETMKAAFVYDTHIVAVKYAGEDNAIVYKFKEGDESATRARYEVWQKKHGVSVDQFLDARMKSDIKEVLQANMKHDHCNPNKLKM